MPVLKHYMGNCHVYVDRAADLDMAERIIVNAKCQRPGVCNAAESLLIHAAVAGTFLPRVAAVLRAKSVELRGCAESRALVADMKPASEEDYAAEYLDLILSVKIVADLEEAIGHIARYGSQHTECIVTNDLQGGGALHRRGRFLGRHGQRQHALQRRLRTGARRRDRHQYRQVSRSWSVRLARIVQLQVFGARGWTSAAVTICQANGRDVRGHIKEEY